MTTERTITAVQVQMMSLEDVRKKLVQMRSTPIRFRLDCHISWLTGVLYESCKARVESRGKTFQMLDAYKKILYDIACWLSSATEATFGLYLSGGVGNGKTTLLYALQDALNLIYFSNISDVSDPNIGYRIISSKELVRMAKAYNNPTRDNIALAEDYKKIMDIQILGIDDLGSEPQETMYYGELITAATDILSHRYHRRKMTFVTTNLSAGKIKDIYGERIADRMREMMHVVNFGSAKSYR